MGASSLRITEVDDDDQTLAVDPPSEGLPLRDPSPVYSTHSPQCVVLHQESSMPNTNCCIHDHTSTLQMQQQIAELQHQISELQQAQRYGQRAQQQTDEVEQPSPLSEYQTQQPWQKKADMVLEKMQQLLDNAREEISQCQQDTIYRNTLIHYRIQEHLRVPLEELPVPMFFIILPKDTSLSEGQRKSPTLTFRLHFLCEGLSHSSTNDTKGRSDIHMTNHLGYDIKDPKEFFGKYGPYILTTMYMIKYGAIASGFVVPPLAHSKLVARIGENQEYLASVKKNIDRLVDIAISYLEGSSTIDSEINTSQWSLTLADKAELRSYLDDIEDESFPGDLHQLVTQGPHCSSWVCGAHHHERIIGHLKDVVNAVGGTYSEDSKKITINCDDVEEQLYEAMTEFCSVQTTDDPSLSASIGQLSLTTSASKAGQEVSITINRLGDLTVDGVKFIQQCNLTKLMVKCTPDVTDEDRLVNILNQCPGLEELHIRCNGERCYDIIHLVISTRETTLREGRKSALHILKVTDERWDPFDYYRGFDGNDHIVSTVTFSRGSTVFDMDTDMRMQHGKPIVEGSPISNFFRQFGWSIVRLAISWHFTNHLAVLLDNATDERGSRLSHLTFSPVALSTLGLDALDQVIKRSQSLNFLWLYCVYLEKESQTEKALLLLGRYGERLNRLTLNSHSMEKWLLPFARLLPTANSFPRLDHICMWCLSKPQVPSEFIQWLVSKAQDRPPSDEQSSNDDSPAGRTLQTRKPCTVLARMYRFFLMNVTLRSQDWEILIKAIDIFKLRELHLHNTNFSSEQLDLLLDRIAATDAHSISLNTLHLGQSELLVGVDGSALRAKIQKVAPQLTITDQ